MKTRTVLTGLLAAVTAVSAAAPAHSITIARITRRGYIVVDEPEAVTPYEGRVPTANTQDTFQFIAELSQLIADTPGAPRGKYLAVMQTSSDQSGALAFYLGLVNDVRGIGQTSPIRRNEETYNLNTLAGTAYPVTGFVWLNNYQLYINGFSDFGKYLICTQEFGHRWGTFVRVPPYPTGAGVASTDAGVDASADADTTDASASDADTADSAPMDAAADAGPTGPMLSVNQLLGRQTAHWSYFVHTEGSPMEGNNWNEIMPGVFRTERPTFKFHPMDQYIMGIMSPQRVRPAFIIAEPDTMGQTDMNRQRISPGSSPEYNGRTVTIRGRRVNFGVSDIIQANGPRIPAARDEEPLRTADGGLPMGPDGGFPEPRVNDMEVVWVLLTTADRVGDRMARDFDRAIDECSDGYSYATDGRSILIPRVAAAPSQPDASAPDASADASVDSGDAAITEASTDASSPTSFSLGGGCACRVTAASTHSSPAKSLSMCALLAGLACVTSARARRRARRA